MRGRTVVDFVASVVILTVTMLWWPGVVMSWLDVLFLSVLLAIEDWLVGVVAGRAVSAKSPTPLGWMLSVALLYVAARLLPHVHLPIATSFVVGSLLWLVGRVFPRVFG